ncbi:hypothetical protein BDK62_12422 [Halomonas alkaliantarctica]|nr:hypothetical protein BDK62_12422 [Halomonas alkaliantarctica]
MQKHHSKLSDQYDNLTLASEHMEYLEALGVAIWRLLEPCGDGSVIGGPEQAARLARLSSEIARNAHHDLNDQAGELDAFISQGATQ